MNVTLLPACPVAERHCLRPPPPPSLLLFLSAHLKNLELHCSMPEITATRTTTTPVPSQGLGARDCHVSKKGATSHEAASRQGRASLTEQGHWRSRWKPKAEQSCSRRSTSTDEESSKYQDPLQLGSQFQDPTQTLHLLSNIHRESELTRASINSVATPRI